MSGGRPWHSPSPDSQRHCIAFRLVTANATGRRSSRRKRSSNTYQCFLGPFRFRAYDFKMASLAFHLMLGRDSHMHSRRR